MNVNLKSGESVTISDSRIDKLMVSGETIPTVYALRAELSEPIQPKHSDRILIAGRCKQCEVIDLQCIGRKGS